MRTMIRQTDTFSKRIPAYLAVLLLLLFLGLTGLVLAGTIDKPDRRISRAIERADTPWLSILVDWSRAAAMAPRAPPSPAGTIDQPDRRSSRAIERADTPWLSILVDWSSAAAMPLLLSLIIPIGW